ncbi:MAG: hypothetical protein HY600_05695 [Candidatus Omnitrophica bacterium]|nr:hypothetical protein [Candidatus Omnitrophota bacterium]
MDDVAAWTRRRRLAGRARQAARLAAGAAGAGAVGMVGWALTRPGPSIAAVAPELPAWELVEPPSPVIVALPEALFPAPAPAAAAKSAAPAVDVASVWRLLGVDAGSVPPRALLKLMKGGQSVWVSVGDELQGVTVAAIEPGRVVLDSPEGSRELRL